MCGFYCQGAEAGKAVEFKQEDSRWDTTTNNTHKLLARGEWTWVGTMRRNAHVCAENLMQSTGYYNWTENPPMNEQEQTFNERKTFALFRFMSTQIPSIHWPINEDKEVRSVVVKSNAIVLQSPPSHLNKKMSARCKKRREGKIRPRINKWPKPSQTPQEYIAAIGHARLAINDVRRRHFFTLPPKIPKDYEEARGTLSQFAFFHPLATALWANTKTLGWTRTRATGLSQK